MLKANSVWKEYVTSFKILLWILKWWKWSFGSVIFLHAIKAFSWFFSYSLSKSSWKASGAPPNSKHEIPLPSWTRGWEPPHFAVSREVCHHQSQLPEERVTKIGTWVLLSSFKADTCCHLVPITASIQWDSPTGAPRWKNEAEALRAWSPENVPSISQLQKHLCPTASSWTAVKIYSVRCFQNFSLLSLRQGGLRAASELLQEVREITISRVWRKCSISVWGVSLEPCVLWASINWSFLPSLSIQSTYTCWAWYKLTLRWIKIWVRHGLQRVNDLVRSNQWWKMIQIRKNDVFGNQKTPMKRLSCITLYVDNLLALQVPSGRAPP